MHCFLAHIDYHYQGHGDYARGTAQWDTGIGGVSWRMIFQFSDGERILQLRYLKVEGPHQEEMVICDNDPELLALARQTWRVHSPDAFRILGYEMLRRAKHNRMRLVVLLEKLRDDNQETRHRKFNKQGLPVIVRVTP